MERVHIRDRETGATRTIELGARTKPGWNKLVLGWSIGGPDSGADIVVAEPLPGAELGVYPASNHVLVWGKLAAGAPAPDIAFADGNGSIDVRPDGTLRLRFDHLPIRIGRSELRFERR